MNYTYQCGGKLFATLMEAQRYASQVFKRDGIILGIEVKK